ncbi:MAG: 4Fe-4S binding protein [Bacillota bacterium]|nr:4Fe-4S binding protein [Bacillota bacterium]
MYVARINPQLCDRSPGCPVRRICPQGAVNREEGEGFFHGGPWKVDPEKCLGCGICLQFCPHQAVELVPAEDR